MEVAKFKERKKNTNRDYCAVSGCKSKAANNLGVSFHHFPKPNQRYVNKQNIYGNDEKIDLFEAWTIALKIKNITKRTTVCSLHFLKSDYLFADVQAYRRILKKNAVPSCNLPVDNRNKINEKDDEARWQRLMRHSNLNETVNTSVNSMDKSAIASINKPIEQIKCEVYEIQDNMNVEEYNKPIEQIKCEVYEIQDNINVEENNKLIEQIKCEVYDIQDNINVEENNNPIEQIKCEVYDIQDNINVEENQTHENNTGMNSSVEKLKEYIICEESEVQNASVTGEKNEIHDSKISALQQFLKDSFVKTKNPEPLVKHQEVQVNTDCFVPSIMKNIHSSEQLNTMTGIESFELLDTIVEMVKKVSGNKFEHLNMIMNTKERVILSYVKLKQNISYSFLAAIFNCYTATHCKRIFYETIKILSKCFKEKEQFTKEESLLTNKIATAGVHVKISNQRIKTFKIVRSVIPATFKPIIEDIFTVIYGTINMSAKLSDDKKFMNVK